jgi:hypothetical protein
MHRRSVLVYGPRHRKRAGLDVQGRPAERHLRRKIPPHGFELLQLLRGGGQAPGLVLLVRRNRTPEQQALSRVVCTHTHRI